MTHVPIVDVLKGGEIFQEVGEQEGNRVGYHLSKFRKEIYKSGLSGAAQGRARRELGDDGNTDARRKRGI